MLVLDTCRVFPLLYALDVDVPHIVALRLQISEDHVNVLAVVHCRNHQLVDPATSVLQAFRVSSSSSSCVVQRNYGAFLRGGIVTGAEYILSDV